MLAEAKQKSTVHKVDGKLNVLLNDGGDINELDELFGEYPGMRNIVEGVLFSLNSTLEGEYVLLTEYYTTDIDEILTAYISRM